MSIDLPTTPMPSKTTQPNWQTLLSQLPAMLGIPGFLGIALMLLAAWLWWGEAPAETQALQDQQNQVSLLRQQLQEGSMAQHTASGPALPLADRFQHAWSLLWKALPDSTAGASLQSEVLAVAQQQGVSVGSVQFKGEALKDVPTVWRQRMTMPVEGSYPAIRRWLSALMQKPSISFDAIDIERTNVMSDQVKARVVMSIWWKLPAVATVSDAAQSKRKEQP